MRDGWHRITYLDGRRKVQYLERNVCEDGSVRSLNQQGCMLEEVEVYTREEMDALRQEMDALRDKLLELNNDTLSRQERDWQKYLERVSR